MESWDLLYWDFRILKYKIDLLKNDEILIRWFQILANLENNLEWNIFTKNI